MPTKADHVPKYCLHKPSGCAYIRVRGKVVYLGRFGTPESKAEYGRLVAELAVAPAGTSTVPPKASPITVVELIVAYLDFAGGYYRKDGKPTGSLENVKKALRPLSALYGRQPALEFTPLCLLALQNHLVASGISRSYANKNVGIVKRMFKWGVSREIIPPHVYHALATVEGLRAGRTAARESRPVLPVTDEVVEATVEHLPKVVADMVRFQRLTGCRPGEVCQLRPMDVERSGEVWTYRPASHKTEHHGRERTVYIGPQAQDVLRPYLLRDAAASCFAPTESERKRHEEMRARRKTRVQPSQRKRRKARPKRQPKTAYDKNSYNPAIRRAVEKANRERIQEALKAGVKPVLLPRWHANQLRHAKATEVRKRFGLEAAQVILGHAKADVTQVYAERDAALAVEVARRIG